MQLTVNKVNKVHEPYSPSGKDWTKYEVSVDCTVDGSEVRNTVVKTFKSDIADKIQAGQSFDVESDVFKGRTSYKINKMLGSSGSAPARKTTVQAPASVGDMTIEDYDALFRHAHDLAVSLVGATDGDSLSRLIATWMIGAKDFRFRIPKAGAAQPAAETVGKSKMELVLAVTKLDHALNFIPKQELEELFEACEKKTNRFAEAVRAMLDGDGPQAEEGEEAPF